MLDSVFLALGDFVVLLAELFFSNKPKKFENRGSNASSGNRGRHDDNGNSINNNKHANQLKEALAFFDNTSLNDNVEHLERVRESVKKQFRKLSLIHHPDRNDNSQESVVIMQKINHYYSIINEELDRRLGIHHDDDSDDDDGNEDGSAAAESARQRQQQRPSSSHQQQQHQQQHQQQNAPTSRSGFTSRKQAAKKARLAQREAAKKASHAQRQADKEMQEMERLYKRQQAQVRRQQQVEIKMAQQEVKRYHLDTTLGRRWAHEAWQKAQVQAQQSAPGDAATAADHQQVPFSQRASYSADIGDSSPIPPMHSSSSSSSMHDIDDDDHDINSGTTTPEGQTEQQQADSTKSKKPINIIMDCCTNEVVVAMRMGMSEAAMTCLLDKMQVYVHNYLLVHRPRDMASLQENVHQAGRCFLTTTLLDGDNNTYLHYAVYYNNGDLVDMIYSVACKFNVLVETFLCKNAHGMIPLDYYYYSNSSAGTGASTTNFDDHENSNANFGRKIKTLTDLARDARDAQPGWNKTTRRFLQVIQNMDIVSILNAVSCVLVGKLVFGTSMLVSFGLATAATWVCRNKRKDNDNEDDESSVAECLFTYHIVWFLCRGLYSFVRLPSLWELTALFAVACSGMILSSEFPMVVRSALLCIVQYPVTKLTWLFQTMRRRLVRLNPTFATKLRLQDLQLLFVFSIGSMGVQWLKENLEGINLSENGFW